jgi:hypothetical protein
MNRIVVDVPHGSLGFDCDQRLSLEQYQGMRALGFRFVMRYLGDLTSDEVDDALGADMMIGAIQHAHLSGWTVDAHPGAEDGRRAVRDANMAALPLMPLWADLEEPSPSTTTAQIAQWSAEWCAAVVHPGHEAEVYWGAGMPGDAKQVYQLAFTGYWSSFSNVVVPWRCGFKMRQLYHFPKGECLVRDVFPQGAPAIVADVPIDVNVAFNDYLGRKVRLCAAG